MTTDQKIRFINNAVKEVQQLKVLSRELRRQLDSPDIEEKGKAKFKEIMNIDNTSKT